MSMNTGVASAAAMYENQLNITKKTTFRGMDLLATYASDGYRNDMLIKIYDMFQYVDMIKDFSPMFVRFDFAKKMTSTVHVSNLFKRLKKNHSSRKRKMFYMCSIEQKKKREYLHAHAFCIVNHGDYRFRRDVKAMLEEAWRHEQSQNHELGDLWIPKAPPGQLGSEKGYNFYSLSTHVAASTAIEEAFKAASYLAKTTQIPQAGMLPEGARLWRCSQMPNLYQDEIRPGFDLQKAGRFMKGTPHLPKQK